MVSRRPPGFPYRALDGCAVSAHGVGLLWSGPWWWSGMPGVHPAGPLVGVGDGVPDGCGGGVLEQVGQWGGEDGNLAQEVGQRDVAGCCPKGVDAGLDAGGAGAVKDEQQPREERVVLAPAFLRRFGEGLLPRVRARNGGGERRR